MQKSVPDRGPEGQVPIAVDLPQAAKMLGVSVRTVRREINRGHLRALRIGRVWRVRIGELDAYLRRLEKRQDSRIGR